MVDDWKIPEERIDEIMEQSEFIEMDCFGCCTVVVMKLPNGFTLVEKSGTIAPEGYDPEIGRRICRENLKGKVWELEGYVHKNEWFKYQFAQARAERTKMMQAASGQHVESES